ncbi:cytochrome P450 [Streptomyces pactum]|uniref:Cytochrome P450 n=1 Tax=Streptomyces pactum TaxID=68249 RepID=A0ABS0NEG3_9ACTN|nr:cytochrome P450 [Streptomyces pactum]MBH5333542.1 cytochrome P450 [Streptomyces pactum]
MDIPGPEPCPDGGAAAVAAAGGLHTYQLRLHAAHGPVVRFPLPGAEEAVSIADPVLLEATAGLDERPRRLFAFLDPLFETGNLQVMPAHEHTPWRRQVLSVLTGRRSHERHFAAFTALATELADRWDEQADGGPVRLLDDLAALSLRMICRYALGGDAADPDRVVAAFEAVLAEHLGRLYPDPDHGPAAAPAAGAQEALAHLRATVDQAVRGHRAGGRTDAGDLIGTLVEAGASPARIRDTVMAVLLAAHHTTGTAVAWTLYLLGHHPGAARRVADELDLVLGDRPAPDHADLRRLEYLRMTIDESMRLYPPGPYGARETTGPLTVGGYRIPAGTTVFYPFWAVHLNPDHWPEPEVFRPERFTSEEAARRPALAHLPFGLGPRACPGAALAMTEAELVLAVLLKRFRFHPVPGHRVRPVERFVLRPADGLPMTVRRRTAEHGPGGVPGPDHPAG